MDTAVHQGCGPELVCGRVMLFNLAPRQVHGLAVSLKEGQKEEEEAQKE